MHLCVTHFQRQVGIVGGMLVPKTLALVIHAVKTSVEVELAGETLVAIKHRR
jgi:hypothetical protein